MSYLLYLKEGVVYFHQVVIPRLIELVNISWKTPDIFWTILPLVISAVGMQVYFGRNRTEEIGWNTAFGNSIIFTFISANLVRFIITNYTLTDLRTNPIVAEKLVLTIGFLIWGLYLMFGDLIHSIPKRIAFLISSSAFINGIAMLAIIIIMSDTPLDKITFFASISFLIIIILIEAIIKHLITPSQEAQESLERKKLKKEEINKIKSTIRKRKISIFLNKVKEKLKFTK